MSHASAIDVFISYARSDARVVQDFANCLRRLGIVVWMDGAIAAGEEWRTAIVEALSRARIVVLVHSRDAERSSEVRKELAVAAALRTHIVPIRVEDTKPSGAFLYEMARLNWVDCVPPTQERMQALALAFSELLRTGADIAAVERFASAVGARRVGQHALLRLARSNAAVLGAVVVASSLLLAAYEESSGYFAQQAAAGVAFAHSLLSAVLVVTLGAPLLFVMSLARLDRAWMWAVAALAALNTLLLLLVLRNWLGWVWRRVAVWRAERAVRSAEP